MAGGLLEAKAVAIHGQDADVVGESIEQGTGEPRGPDLPDDPDTLRAIVVEAWNEVARLPRCASRTDPAALRAQSA